MRVKWRKREKCMCKSDLKENGERITVTAEKMNKVWLGLVF